MTLVNIEFIRFTMLESSYTNVDSDQSKSYDYTMCIAMSLCTSPLKDVSFFDHELRVSMLGAGELNNVTHIPLRIMK